MSPEERAVLTTQLEQYAKTLDLVRESLSHTLAWLNVNGDDAR